MPPETPCPNPSCANRDPVAESVGGGMFRCKWCGRTFAAGNSTTINTAPSNDGLGPAWDPVTARAPTPEPTSTLVGHTIGRFAIRGKLGAGAFGTVYRAYDPQLDRVVALKVPNPGVMTDAKRAERFLREAKAAANLRHPHIVPVFDAGKDGDSYYIAGAFIDGAPLADSIPEGGTDFTRAARLVRELAEALAYAHEQGVVHRDVKPPNVMIDRHDRVHLMDFGLASRLEEQARLTNDGAVMGTPSYMAPEQAAGQKGEAQPATDQYAAGVVLYELLTGRTPFTGPLAVVVHNVIHTHPDPPRKYRADVPKDLETICAKAMAKRPEHRYASCQFLADDLRRWLEGEPVTTRTPRLWERARRWVQKEPKLAGAIAVIALVLVLCFALVTASARRADEARAAAERDADAARAAESQAELARELARAAERRAEDALAAALRASELTLGALGTAAEERQKAVSFAAQTQKETDRANDLQAKVDKQRADVETPRQKADTLRAEVAYWRKLADTKTPAERHPLQLAYHACQNGAGADANSFLQAVPVNRRGWEWRHVHRLCGAAPDQPGLHQHTFTGARVEVRSNADELRVVTTEPNGVTRVWNAQTGDLLHTLKGHTAGVSAAAFTPDGTRVATASRDGTARVWDTKNATPIVLRAHTKGVTAVAFSPDGKLVATASADGTARVWSAKTGFETHVLNGHRGEVSSVTFARDGKRMLTCGLDGTARVWDTKSGALVRQLPGTNGAASVVSFSPDGNLVVGLVSGAAKTSKEPGQSRDVQVWDAVTGQELFLFRATGAMLVTAFSPDGQRLVTASADGTARVWSAATGEECLLLPVGMSSVSAAAFSPDGKRIVTAGNDGAGRLSAVQVWDAESGERLLSIGYGSEINSAVWSSDGSKMLIGLKKGSVDLRDGSPPPRAKDAP